MATALRDRLRGMDVAARISAPAEGHLPAVLAEWQASGVAFACSTPAFEDQYYRAVRELFACIRPTVDKDPILNEGGVYLGCWLESTGTINTELMSRFLPGVAGATYAKFAKFQRDDGLFPYKLTGDGPAWNQIQIVTPFARSVWNHYLLNGRDRQFLEVLYRAMAANDNWLAANRNTRGTGGVEAFCTFDTGHDLSSRFWHVPDTPHENDPARYNPDNPVLPFVAPDLTANVACQRDYLALMAEELGEDGAAWRQKAEASREALFAQCFDEADGFFYDRDRHGRLNRLQSDVLLRVLASEVGDEAFFAKSLERYLLNTRKFFAKYPLTSVAMDDPRFDPAFAANSWSGPSNFLSIIRTAHAFEHHHRHTELTFIMQPILSALMRFERFSQTVGPFNGRPGYTEVYSPTILCLIDFVERLSGILPRPDGTLWFTGLTPYQTDHRYERHETAYARTVDGAKFELVNGIDSVSAFRDGAPLFTAPAGVRVVTDRKGDVKSLIGMVPREVAGDLEIGGNSKVPFKLSGNQQLDLKNKQFTEARSIGVVPPGW